MAALPHVFVANCILHQLELFLRHEADATSRRCVAKETVRELSSPQENVSITGLFQKIGTRGILVTQVMSALQSRLHERRNIGVKDLHTRCCFVSSQVTFAIGSRLVILQKFMESVIERPSGCQHFSNIRIDRHIKLDITNRLS